jgi:hypothetical protein
MATARVGAPPYVTFHISKRANAFKDVKSAIEGFPRGDDRRPPPSHRSREVPMLKRTAFVLTAMAGLALSPGSASASSEVARYSFSGAGASFQFVTTTSVACPGGGGGFAMVIGYLSAAEQVYSYVGSPFNGTFVEIDAYYNSCTGLSFSGTGSISGGFTPPDKKLTSARLTGSGTVQNLEDGGQFPISLDIQVVGVGATVTLKSSSHSKTTATKQGPLLINHDHSANTNRPGEASGSITIDGITFPGLESYYGSLNANGSATIVISK